MFYMILCLAVPILLWISHKNRWFDAFCFMIMYHAKVYRCHMRPKRLILIRHGESQGNQDPSFYSNVPDNAISLTENGRKQALRCGEKLREIIGPKETLYFYVSPFRRCQETCECIRRAFPEERILKVREDPRIREQEWGNLQDSSEMDSIRNERKKVGRFFYRFRGGESGADVYDRVSSFIDSLIREMSYLLEPNNNICIVSHGLFMRLFLMRFYRWKVEEFEKLENFDNCDICILERSDLDGSFVLTTDLKRYEQ